MPPITNRLKSFGSGKSIFKNILFWRILLVAAAGGIGFLVRSGFAVRGFVSLNSDEVFAYHFVQAFAGGTDAVDFIPQPVPASGLRLWISYGCYLLAGRQLDKLVFFVCLLNVFLYLLWAHVLVKRTGHFWAAAPLLVFLVFPPPSISYGGTQLSEFRSFYFYGALLTLFAGKWFRTRMSSFVFGLLACAGCVEDLFTFFFVLPVLWYELVSLVSSSWKVRLEKISLFGFGTGLVFLFLFRESPWPGLMGNGYVHFGIGHWNQWKDHFILLVRAWPSYWFGGIPWSYLQNSKLGMILTPVPWTRGADLLLGTFWSLLGATTWGFLKAHSKKERWKEIILWSSPPAFFILFFIFGSQTWDALTLRYLGYWGIFIPLMLGLWAAILIQPWKNRYWVLMAALWAVLHAAFLVPNFLGPAPEHPGRRIAARLEQAGCTAGFANYWVSEMAGYYSRNRVLLTPYNHIPLSRRAFLAARDSRKIGLVWVEGLDHPETQPEVIRQIESLGYSAKSRMTLDGDSWSVLVFEKRFGRL